MENDRTNRKQNKTILILLLIIVLCSLPIIFILGGGLDKITEYRENNPAENVDVSEVASEVIEDIEVVASEIIGSEGEVVTEAHVNIEDIVAINELQTLTYVYNDICVVYEDSDESTDTDREVKYYISYEGTVTLGINTSEIRFDYGDESNKVITVVLPKVQILSQPTVNTETLDYIFIDEKCNRIEYLSNDRSYCEADLAEKIANDSIMMELAEENTMAEVRALTEPLVEQFYPDYTIEFVWEQE